MKKIVASILTGMMILSMTACGTASSSDSGAASSSTSTTTSTTTSSNADSTSNAGDSTESDVPANVNPVELMFFPKTSGSYATIKIDATKVTMDDESAWLGLVPAGKDYVTELEADEVDVIWFSLEGGREDDSDPYVFACDFESVEDGRYALVVATSDDENVGYIAIQLEMVKDGDSLTFDYSNAQIKERP